MALTAAFRVDASRRIGSGHVYRCLALAEALRVRGARSVFIHREHEGNLRPLIESRGFPVHLLLPPKADAGLLPDPEYAQWLGVAEATDAQESLDVIQATGAEMVIVDHYALGPAWEATIKPHVGRVVAIDDLPGRRHACDLLIHQVGTTNHESAQPGAESDVGRVLAGPNYALIDATYAAARRLMTPRSELGRILIFFGASDQLSLTPRALRVLSRAEFQHIAIDIVAGINDQHSMGLEALGRDRGRVVLHAPQESLAPLMLRADLMIGAAGMTSWERCTVGLPSIAVVTAENQRLGADLLLEAGAARTIDARGADNSVRSDFERILREELLALLDKPAELAAMSVAGPRVADGCGAGRVAEQLIPSGPESTRLRSVREDDRSLLFRWVSDADVRRASFISEPIDWDDHADWFTRLRRDPASRIWILETQDDVPVGQFRVSVQDGVGLVDYSVDADFRGRGLGREIRKAGLEAWRSQSPGVPLRAETKSDNQRSRAALESAGWTNADGAAWDPGGARVSILTDQDSWLNEFVPGLVGRLLGAGRRVHWTHSHRSLVGGDICFILGYSRILGDDSLGLHVHNLVVHESDLPRGRGWSPLTWQVLEGADEITVSLIEAAREVDSGPIYRRATIHLRGDEFVGELRAAQWAATERLVTWFINDYPDSTGQAEPQRGEQSFYPRRGPNDSRLDPNLPLTEQMALLRVVDNRRYPAFVAWQGRRIRLEVHPDSRWNST